MTETHPSTAAPNRFDQKLLDAGKPPLRAVEVSTLQVNVGKLCDQACKHCHVDAGPHQTGADVNMGAEVAARVIKVLQTGKFEAVDLTGGAPELNPHFRDIVRAARAAGVRVIDRCNLSVLFEPGQTDLADFLAEHQVEVSASLPFYTKDRTDRQRGSGTFDKSIEGLKVLNGRGYGKGNGLVLNLVYNPVGAYLSGNQQELQADYKRELLSLFGITFDALHCITNMPIARYLEWLERSGNLEGYMTTLLSAFNPTAVDNVMCKFLVSIAPDGAIYDCDFNQMLDLPMAKGLPRNLLDWDLSKLATRKIVTGEHCLGCTAGAGSSCGGEVT